ncbi:MAG: CRTAC1 family protein [Planctomycetaceae bacterium]
MTSLPNHLYHNRHTDGFAEIGELSGVALNEAGSPEGSMGVDAGDFDGDGHLDLWTSNFEMEDNSLYRNSGARCAFVHTTSAVGLGGQGRTRVGFGTGMNDFDADGWPDIYVLNGHVLYHGGTEPFQQMSLLFRNIGGRKFENVSEDAGPWFQVPHAARGAAAGDINDDGRLDLIVSVINENVAVLKNRHPSQNWIRLKASGTSSARSAVGTRVSIHAFGRDCVQNVKCGAGYLSHSDDRLFFALPKHVGVVDVRVVWPAGLEEVFTDLQAGTDHVMIEGHGKRR